MKYILTIATDRNYVNIISQREIDYGDAELRHNCLIDQGSHVSTLGFGEGWSARQYIATSDTVYYITMRIMTE